MTLTIYLQRLQDEYDRLFQARCALLSAEESLLRSKLQLAEAERELDELRLRLQAAAPRDTFTNEAQRRAFALDGSETEARRTAELRRAHLDAEIGHLRARHGLRAAEDGVRLLEAFAAITARPPETFAGLPLPEKTGVPAE